MRLPSSWSLAEFWQTPGLGHGWDVEDFAEVGVLACSKVAILRLSISSVLQRVSIWCSGFGVSAVFGPRWSLCAGVEPWSSVSKAALGGFWGRFSGLQERSLA